MSPAQMSADSHLELTEEEVDTLLPSAAQAPRRLRRAPVVIIVATLFFVAVVALPHRPKGFLELNARSFSKFTQLFSTSTSFCYQGSGIGNCWAQKPSAGTLPCSVDSGSTTCRCPASDASWSSLAGPTGHVGCHIDNLPTTTGRCAQKHIYVYNSSVEHNGNSVDVAGSSQEKYCKNMVKNDQWQANHLVPLDSDGPDKTDDGYWSCWHWDYSWQDGGCYRKHRYIGERCWDGWWGGDCAGASDKSYDEYSTACYNGKCMPFAWVQDRQECQCAWVGWNFIVACSAANGMCGGHACVLSTGDGKKYCDYASSSNWGSIL